MINKIGKVLKSSVKTPKALKSNIRKSTGMLKAGLNDPSNMQKLASKLNNMDEAIGKINKTYHKDFAKDLGINGSLIANKSRHLTKSGRYGMTAKIGDAIGTKIENTAVNISKYDKAVGFDLKKALTNDLKLHATQVTNIAGSMFEKTDKNLLGVKLNKKGMLVAGGVSLIGGVPQATNKFNETTMGTQRDAHITPFAPKTPAYQNNGGATGDLVFALNQNRKG